ncbi:MAG: hypothetical protein DRP76_01920 [Candidatus Omnitrophota bacterium]|nr:MAG: hypothetical protein DRP76_01920 [Candidatus Omnitrophota bacterium]
MKRSFTLVEILVSVGIVVIIIGAIFFVTKAVREFFSFTSLKIELWEKAKEALSYMEKEILSTRSSFLSIPADSNFYHSLTFRIPQDIDEDGNITWSENITYSLSNHNLIRTQGASTQIISSGVEELKFRIESGLPQVVEIYITVSGVTPYNRTISVTLDTKVRIRN